MPSVDDLAKVIWESLHPGGSWEARLTWATASPQERAEAVQAGADPDCFDDNGDIEQARKTARAVQAMIQ